MNHVIVDCLYMLIDKIKYFFQKIFRGFSDQETWNLDTGILEYVYPRLKRYKEIAFGWPTDFESEEEWKEVLDKIILWIEYQIDKRDWLEDFKENGVEYSKYYEEGLNLFNKYWSHFWW